MRNTAFVHVMVLYAKDMYWTVIMSLPACPLEQRYLMSLRGHVASVYQVAWSADSRLLVSGSSDSTLKVWDIKTGKLNMDLPGHADEVREGKVLLPDNFDGKWYICNCIVSCACRFMQWTGVPMDREWPVAGKTNVSECERDARKPCLSFFCVSSHLTLWPCVSFPDGEDSHTCVPLY